ncbi:hypothetical protein L6452_38407 [Arctium lappa]|uniref:Uncharacterized protein n=1 Tax=Arctium lappa TaxID=4217 RepID=A0ACB8Y6U5_ARCLA|nr:hypothetical protein L6452_38407 [Arctium lappa]
MGFKKISEENDQLEPVVNKSEKCRGIDRELISSTVVRFENQLQEREVDAAGRSVTVSVVLVVKSQQQIHRYIHTSSKEFKKKDNVKSHEPRWSKQQQLFDHETGQQQHSLFVENSVHQFAQQGGVYRWIWDITHLLTRLHRQVCNLWVF